MSRIVLGVAGGIAAYKACLLLRLFTEAGHHVTVVPTPSALNFVGEATWAALSGNPVHTQVWSDADQVPHVRLGREADLVVVAPATADLMARAASGRADDLLTNVLLTAHCPVLMAPAMHTEMWQHPATVANVATLRERGVVVLDPDSGRLTGADTGPGRLPEPEQIEAVALSLLHERVAASARERDLVGVRLTVSAGGTHEALDPVRFIGNSSSGRMGMAIARAALLRGAQVRVVAAAITAPVPGAAELVRVVSTGDLAEAMAAAASDSDVLIMAAAPADFTPERRSDGKLKKSGDEGLTVRFVQTTDVLKSLVAGRCDGQVIVGFAAETAADPEQLMELGRAKLARKGCDLLVLNDVSGGAVFGSADNAVTIIDRGGVVDSLAADKNLVAHRILDAVVNVRKSH
ncbi:bifunctional phosphopantothenoylcysteine decarboxylase/phosphopantothenate--cysteine ligase CoaBC [Micropruina sonneratiae]|uniref:bifunctional phosphopantothenoylcysteine decarboxylase/phosphopantothenate--cysteine ligase CoaBC n=1 Tax=Micropruina sonneratiae TaxID=2986940 RepID=UPI002226986D|nr:bifunctional phosphopantothenoylcysteine decarboxylase/phosphopantothenate--cysteine ligase CoaBC [Micropruina sp. KQZ13P-5]MCW3157716.1 bifunctional phosphopantothenoylcysteine decarboxylase/phosphopantothenate--cysteine ligase CoaBC [Micropruina sp. KQZ13P-5]